VREHDDYSKIDFILNQTLPQAIIIGTAKCGTSTLREFIGAHPDVGITHNEIQFFDIYYERGLEWYRKQMPYTRRSQMTIEKTPDYYKNALVPARVYKMNPNIKLIVSVRDPVIRAVSHYVHLKTEAWFDFVNHTLYANMTDSQRFAHLIYANNNKSRRLRRDYEILSQGFYYRHLQSWLEYFSIEQFVFLDGDKLKKDPIVVIEKLQSFLGLRPFLKREHFVKNASKSTRGGLSCVVNPLKKVKCMGSDKGRKHPYINESILNDLRGLYRCDSKKFFNLIGEKPWWPI